MKKVIWITILIFLILSFVLSTAITVVGCMSVAALEQIASDEGVSVTYVSQEALDSIAQQFGHRSAYGAYFHGSKQIYVSVSSPCPWWTLAHENGHHFAITYESDSSELRADEIAYELIITGRYNKCSKNATKQLSSNIFNY